MESVNEAGLDERASFDIIGAAEPPLAATGRVCANGADAEARPPDMVGKV